MSGPRRETTLHLLFVRDDQAAIITAIVDKTTYFGNNIAEIAQDLELDARQLRRIYFQYFGEVKGVARATSVWQMHLEDADHPLNWQPVQDFNAEQQKWIEEAQKPPACSPWMKADWYDMALHWLDEELAAQNLRRIGPPKTLKHWQISLLWQVNTDIGSVFFKAVPAFFANEVMITPHLAQEIPNAAPQILAANTQYHFLLMSDAGTPAQSLTLEQVLPFWANLQRNSESKLTDWQLNHRGPEYVHAWLDALLSDNCLHIKSKDAFTAEEAQQLRHKRKYIEQALERLANSPIPRTLGHCDLHAENILQKNGQLTLIDWSDICITHPFMDTYMTDFKKPSTYSSQACDLYLMHWQDIASNQQLKQWQKDGEIAGELLKALGYVDGIQPAVDDKTEWQDTHLQHMRNVLSLISTPIP